MSFVSTEGQNLYETEQFIKTHEFPKGMRMRIGDSEKKQFKMLEFSYQRKKYPVPTFATRISLADPVDYVQAQVRQFHRQYCDLANKYNDKIAQMTQNLTEK